MKHTKGEWKVEYDSNKIGEPGHIMAIDGEKKEYICTTSGNVKANSTLIAAAPDMLEALQNLIGLQFANVDSETKVRLEKAIQAIKKATL